MIAEIGHFALWLALAVSVAQWVLCLRGAHQADARWMRAGLHAVNAQFLLVLGAFVALGVSFVQSDFTIINVAHNSNSKLPVEYRFAATWGSHEGSLLLWALMLAGWSAAVNAFGGALSTVFKTRVVGVLGLVATGFLAFMLITSNPFLRRFPAPADGRDLNPLLQDPGMVIHPPMLYMGYVGFSVAFAFAIAAMLGGRVDAAWTRWARPWTAAAWAFLTIGIALGSAWAYYELGWGGWWFWDPVENASFMPWLVGTALMHSLIVTERRGGFRAWTLLLAIAAFSLSLLGTFLVRSGVLTSVHAFASDPQRGLFILGFLVVVVGGSLVLFALRGPSVTGDAPSPEFSASSREGYLLANNLLMVTAAGSVLLGTLYPLVLDTLDMAKISVGPPYFEAVFFPLMAPAAFLMGVGPLARWRQAPLPSLAQRLKWAFAIALVTMIVTVVLRDTSGSGSLFGSIAFASGIFLGIWLILASGVALHDRASQIKAASLLERWRALPASTWAMALAHAGVGVFCIGVACVKTLEVEIDSALGPQQSLTISGYRMTLTAMGEVQGPNYRAVRARIEVQPASGAAFVLEPEKRFYPVTQSVMTEAAIDSGFTRDVYVSLGEQLPDGRWTVKAWVKPFIDWIWAGCFLMALGGFLTMADRRYRATRVAAAQSAGSPATARTPAG